MSKDVGRPAAGAEYEYGVRFVRRTGAHRWGMSARQAHQWISEWDADIGKPGTFVVIRRWVGEWHDAPEFLDAPVASAPAEQVPPGAVLREDA